MIKIHVSRTLEGKIRQGHPWVFHYQIQNEIADGKPGDLAVVYDAGNRFLAIGLFDPESDIRLRILQARQPVKIDSAFFEDRLKQALRLRDRQVGEDTTGYRVINGENDGFPGLVLDRYADTAVLKLYTSAWIPYIENLLPLFKQYLPVDRCVLRWSRKAADSAGVSGAWGDGQVLFGAPVTAPVLFREHDLRFEADVLCGQKTGFFLDQRENRQYVRSFSAGKSVLNVFSYTGGFSVHAFSGGCRSVLEIDVNPIALAASERNLRLNFPNRDFAPEEFEQTQGDAFETMAGLKARKRKFDLVILDPPAFAKRKKHIQIALDAYEHLAKAGAKLIANGGVLFSASCSVHVDANDFFEAVFSGIKAAGLKYEEIRRTGHAPDHPVTFRQGEYLKGVFCRCWRVTR
ncbi:SAM-dependent methyltransferase [Candidatus Nitromaritima sp. SCGC AAA799-A02]|nr:SAM-dependent methyltransferase [Candidatus Nitromaritima sp. SCGC AAA799-C22]KMP12001.1 SAM-dependent methyltransferase [Candidatus Nitromaritima sp. SCGC AAA799-A02]